MLVVIWCIQVAWVGKTAQERGRNWIVWTVLGAAAGVFGGYGGVVVFAHVVEESETMSGFAMLALLVPLVGTFAPTLAIGLVLKRSEMHVGTRKTWQVQFMDRGPGSITI